MIHHKQFWIKTGRTDCFQSRPEPDGRNVAKSRIWPSGLKRLVDIVSGLNLAT